MFFSSFCSLRCEAPYNFHTGIITRTSVSRRCIDVILLMHLRRTFSPYPSNGNYNKKQETKDISKKILAQQNDGFFDYWSRFSFSKSTMFENHRKSLIRHCKLRLHFEWTKVKIKIPKIVHFGEFFKTWSLRSNSVTRQVSFKRTKIGRKCPNSNATF